MSSFDEEYKKLNKEQKEAVNTTDGPVMVVAGPGTGKTQILALRIGNILKKTDTGAGGVLALTFTNSAVEAMQKRLTSYIGEAAEQVNVLTFHSLGMKIVGGYYQVLGLPATPTLLDDSDTAILFDEVLSAHNWQYLRPRGNSTKYFSDLRSLISLLKRERITSGDFLNEIEKEIKFIESDSENISTRGESKGQLKKEFLNKIEGLERSHEVAKFFDLYERVKKDKNVFDYDDVLENLVKIVELSKDAVSDIREKYLYVLVDEHQDSSRVQNEFLSRVWGKVEDPNIFVVGDDRQLIYGFSGASIDHFAGFRKTFKKSKLITLVDNYRSTQVILDASHALLQSVMTKEKLVSKNKESHPLSLLEAKHHYDEIAACALDIKSKIEDHKLNINNCAILVPKNRQVRVALEILHEMGLPVSSLDALNLFDQEEALMLLRVLRVVNDSTDGVSLARSFFDESSGITPLDAHAYIATQKMREFSFDLITGGQSKTLFPNENAVESWINKLLKWQKFSKEQSLLESIKTIGTEFLLTNKSDSGKLVPSASIVDTIIALVEKQIEKNPKITFPEFTFHLSQLESFGEHIPLVLPETEGVKVLTMHSSKGLEFDYVWIAHMDERSLTSGKKLGFVLPEGIAERVEERDVDRIKRKLYVAITRARKFCTISYALHSDSGGEQEVARIIQDLPKEVFSRRKVGIPTHSGVGRKIYSLELTKLVLEKYTDRYVSASLLNNFFECPWMWYFRNLLQLPESENESLKFGIAVHAAIDVILKMDHAPSALELEGLKLDKEVLVVISKWVKNRLPEIKSKRANEEGISIKDENFPHLKIFGKIDLIEWLGGEIVRITDFKTGTIKKKSEIEKLDEEGRLSSLMRQLAMYSYLIKQSPKWKVNVRESRLEFLEAKPARAGGDKKEIFYDRVITDEEVKLLIKDISDYDQSIKTGEWINRPCNYNSYDKNTECEYCKLAEIYLR